MNEFHQIFIRDENGKAAKLATIHVPSYEMAEIIALCLDNLKQQNAQIYIRSRKFSK